MKSVSRIYSFAAISVLISTALTPVLASTSTHHAKHHMMAKMALKTTWPQVCPVSGEKIASAKDAVGHSTYKGKTYYFCCSMCKPQFDKDPAKYAAAAAKGKYLAPM